VVPEPFCRWWQREKSLLLVGDQPSSQQPSHFTILAIPVQYDYIHVYLLLQALIEYITHLNFMLQLAEIYVHSKVFRFQNFEQYIYRSLQMSHSSKENI